jgi:hypothetical protein
LNHAFTPPGRRKSDRHRRGRMVNRQASLGPHEWLICARLDAATRARRAARIRQGDAISQGGDAQRPLTHCDSYRLPGMLLLACRSRSCAQLEVSYRRRRQTPQAIDACAHRDVAADEASPNVLTLCNSSLSGTAQVAADRCGSPASRAWSSCRAGSGILGGAARLVTACLLRWSQRPGRPCSAEEAERLVRESFRRGQGIGCRRLDR